MMERAAVIQIKRFVLKPMNLLPFTLMTVIQMCLTNTGLHRLEVQVPHLQDRVPVEILFYHHQEKLLRERGRLVIWVYLNCIIII